jgi:hypothetical protein
MFAIAALANAIDDFTALAVIYGAADYSDGFLRFSDAELRRMYLRLAAALRHNRTAFLRAWPSKVELASERRGELLAEMLRRAA